MVVDIVSGDHSHVQLAAQLEQALVPQGVSVNQVLLKLDEDVGGPEPPQIVSQTGFSLLLPAFSRQAGDLALPAAGQQNEALGVFRKPSRVQLGIAPVSSDAGVSDELAQVAVPHRSFHQQGKVGAVDKGNLGPDDGLNAHGFRRAGKLHGPAEVVMVGQGQRRMFQGLGPYQELTDRRRSLLEGVIAVAVELAVADAHSLTLRPRPTFRTPGQMVISAHPGGKQLMSLAAGITRRRREAGLKRCPRVTPAPSPFPPIHASRRRRRLSASLWNRCF